MRLGRHAVAIWRRHEQLTACFEAVATGIARLPLPPIGVRGAVAVSDHPALRERTSDIARPSG